MFIYLLIFILLYLICYYYINLRYFFPKKRVIDFKLNKILIGLPMIDRDSHLFNDFYNSISNSINNIKNIKFDFLVVTRKNDYQVINFWKNKSKIIKVDNYQIKKRHNMKNLSKKFNIIKNYSKINNYDALIFIESDIIIEKKTIQNLINSLNKSHVSLFPFKTPWINYPLILEDNYYYKFNNSRNINKNEINILGHGTGCMIINKQVINDDKINFNSQKIFNIEGQDIGFFNKIHQNFYKVLMINQELLHAY